MDTYDHFGYYIVNDLLITILFHFRRSIISNLTETLTQTVLILVDVRNHLLSLQTDDMKIFLLCRTFIKTTL